MSTAAPPLPIEPIRQLEQWSRVLAALAQRPLTFCPHLPAIARRWETWWAHQPMDRPIILAAANKNPDRPVNKRIDLLDQPHRWLKEKRRDMEQTHHVGESLPFIRVDFGPAMIGGLLGAPTDFGADTTWTHAFINDDWSNAPRWELNEDHPWWMRLCELTRMTAADAAGNYVVCAPDIGGAADPLLNMRGPEGLCMDALEQPRRITDAMDAIYPVWRRVFSTLYDLTTSAGAGLIHWIGPWSSRPYVVPTCDFNYMIGPEEFRGVCVPDLARLAATAGRAAFHLDGPGATRHIDALLEMPQLQVIQFTPGAATPSALAWVDMFRKIQRAGKGVLVFTPPEEVLPLCAKLEPRGLALSVTGGLSPQQTDDLFTQVCRRFGCTP